MNTRRKPTRRDKGEVANERVPLWNEQVSIVDKKEVNEEVPPPAPQRPQVPQIPPIPHGSKAPYVEMDMTNAEIREAFRASTQLMTTQAHVATIHVVAQADLVHGRHSNVSTPTYRI